MAAVALYAGRSILGTAPPSAELVLLYASNQQPTKRLGFDETDNQIAALLVLIISGSFHFVVDDGADLFFRGGIIIGRLPVKLDQNICRGNGHHIVKIMNVVAHKILLEIGS